MKFKTEIYDLLKKISEKENGKKLPGNAFFLDENAVVNLPRDDGDSRYPLDVNGYTLWTYASGYMHAREGRFYTLGWRQDGDESDINFFAGLPLDNGKYEQVSLLGIPVKVNDSVKRYTVFTPYATYYITEYKGFIFCVRACVSRKNLVFSVFCENKSGKEQKIIISNYISPLILCQRNKDYDFRWFKSTELIESKNNLKSAVSKNMGLILNAISKKPTKYFATTSRDDFAGGKARSSGTSKSIYEGEFTKFANATMGTSDSIYGDIKLVSIENDEFIRSEMTFTCFAEKIPDCALNQKLNFDEIDKECEEIRIDKSKTENRLRIKFGKSENDYLDSETFNDFLSFVKRQTDFSSFTKYYGWSEQLGMRDIWQQVEPTLLWNPESFKKMALKSLSVVEVNGRVPRQYAPPVFNLPITMDLTLKIDQGVWIISTMYTYLASTGDFDFLNERCSYYEYPNDSPAKAFISTQDGTVLDHLIRIMEFLIDSIDRETGCVRVFVGDWNDALTGMGASLDPNEKFGTGASIMVTLQVYQNLNEMISILEKVNSEEYDEKINFYHNEAEKLKISTIKNAVIENEKGEKRILHGWGDKKSYLVGSFNDADGKSRISTIVHSFWLLSGIIDYTPELKDMVINNLHNSDSEYGIRTFDEPFTRAFKQLRIGGTPSGMLENGSAYVHNSAFAVLALLKNGEYEFAFEQLKKLIPYTHKFVSHSPFVMCNAYMKNKDLSVDGVAVNDWQTGSAAVLLKIVINQICGYQPDLDGLYIAPCDNIPFKDFTFDLDMKRYNLSVKYSKSSGKRKFILNGVEMSGVYDKKLKIDKLFIPNNVLESNDKLLLEIID